MKTPGSLLKTRREERGLEISHIESETQITQDTLKALENDDYNSFSAETYYIGFLKVYGEHLGIESQVLLKAFNEMKDIEKPMPLRELTGLPRPPIGRRVVIILLILLLAAVMAVIYYFFLQASPNFTWIPFKSGEARPQPTKRTIELSSLPWQDELFSGDLLLLELDGKIINLQLDVNGSNISLNTLETALREEISLYDGQSTIIGVGSNKVALRMINHQNEQNSIILRAESAATDAVPVISEEEPVMTGAIEEKILLQSAERAPLKAALQFKKGVLLRYQSDEEAVVQKFYNPDESAEITADENINIWLSNAAAVTATINDHEVSFGEGVVCGAIVWDYLVNIESGSYNLRMIPLY